MEKLYEIDDALEQVIETGYAIDFETGEVLFDESDLDMLQMSLEKKLEGCACVIKEQSAMIDALKAEEQSLKARRAVLERKNERLKAYVGTHMGNLPKSRLETSRASLSLRHGHKVEVFDESLVPNEFVTVTETRKVSKTELAKAFKAGELVAGAAWIETESLQVK